MGTYKYLKNKIMGNVYSYIFGSSEEPNQNDPKLQEKQSSAMNNEDMVVLKMKIQKDKYFNKIKSTEKIVKELHNAILNLIKQKPDQKQQAKHKISRKKTLEEAWIDMTN